MYLIFIRKLFPPSFLLPSISYKSNVALQQRHLWSTKRVYPNDELNIVGKFSLSASRPQKKIILWIFQHGKSVTDCWKIHEMRQKNLLWPVEADNQFSYFFYKSVFFLKKNRKKYKKIRKNQMTSKTGCPPYNLLGNLFFGGLVFCWYFKYILPKLLFWELSAGQGRGERMGLPWKI